jgi:nucleotide-binding universal stress UspA family protein
MLFQKILFPVDFSGPCERVVPSVAAMQQAMRAQLILLHSIDLPCDWPAHHSGKEWFNYDSLCACDDERLARFGATRFDGRHLDLLQESGDPATAILRSVEKRNIDLIMMPTHGYGMFRRALIGSVTTKVLHDVPCAVWTAAHSDSIPSPAYKRILCAIDAPHQSADLLRSASELAHLFQASLAIVHAYPDFAGTLVERYERPIPKRAEASIRRRLDALQHSAGADALTVIAGGEVNEVIAETARRQKADLVVIGRGTFGGFLTSPRSHLYDIIRSSPCPVLVLKKAD